jgi:hypothetical protein
MQHEEVLEQLSLKLQQLFARPLKREDQNDLRSDIAGGRRG